MFPLPGDPFSQSLFAGFVGMLVSMGSHISIPTDMISTLNMVIGYGNWIIGEDLVIIIFSTVTFWLTQKLIFGLVTFVWENLPLT